MIRRSLLVVGLFLIVSEAQAQQLDLGRLLPEGGGAVSGRILQFMLLLTVLSLAPAILIMVTCFTRFVVALSFLRSGLGLMSTPANLVLISLSLFMTFYVMAPTFDRAWQQGVLPLLENQITEGEALERASAPFREFMLAQVREKDLRLFSELADASFGPQERASIDLRILIPAFMISELRRGFEIGFLILLPFLVIDIIVATLVMSMGMMMMPPTVIALPIKVLFFILIDGWNLVVGSLVRSIV
jgi:flagellar biosynthetic protein FliP